MSQDRSLRISRVLSILPSNFYLLLYFSLSIDRFLDFLAKKISYVLGYIHDVAIGLQRILGFPGYILTFFSFACLTLYVPPGCGCRAADCTYVCYVLNVPSFTYVYRKDSC